jgi:hypothetical protein
MRGATKRTGRHRGGDIGPALPRIDESTEGFNVYPPVADAATVRTTIAAAVAVMVALATLGWMMAAQKDLLHPSSCAT